MQQFAIEPFSWSFTGQDGKYIFPDMPYDPPDKALKTELLVKTDAFNEFKFAFFKLWVARQSRKDVTTKSAKNI